MLVWKAYYLSTLQSPISLDQQEQVRTVSNTFVVHSSIMSESEVVSLLAA